MDTSAVLLELLRQGAQVIIGGNGVITVTLPDNTVSTETLGDLGDSLPDDIPESISDPPPRKRTNTKELCNRIHESMQFGKEYTTREVTTLVGQDPESQSDYQRISNCLKKLREEFRVECQHNEGSRAYLWLKQGE